MTSIIYPCMKQDEISSLNNKQMGTIGGEINKQYN